MKFLKPMIALALAFQSATAFIPRNSVNKASTAMFATKAYPIMAEEEVMSQKAHGTSERPVQKKLRWNCDYQTADRIWYARSFPCIVFLVMVIFQPHSLSREMFGFFPIEQQFQPPLCRIRWLLANHGFSQDIGFRRATHPVL